MTATRLALINGRAVLPDRIVTGLALMVADGRYIAGLARPADLGAGHDLRRRRPLHHPWPG